jgi:hypothetical protein
VMVKPCIVTSNLVAGLLVLPGLMSKARSRWLPSTTTVRPLVFLMSRVLLGGLAGLGMMSKSPVALFSVAGVSSGLAGGIVIL